jgi:DNA-directed RNA polymerase specialized sigma subunit
MSEAKKPVHYVDNVRFLEEIEQYKKACLEAEEAGEDKPIIPNYLGECVLKIATKLANRPNFINYSYKDDMILDGIENCIMYFDNFDPAKSKNPFSYFTQIIYYAFLRRIEKEKKQSYIRGKLIRDTTIESFETQESDHDEDFQNSYIGFMQQHGTFDDTFEERRKKKKKKKPTALEEFIGENPIE